jgi:hypothetical protein
MSYVCPQYAPKRTSAHRAEFMSSRSHFLTACAPASLRAPPSDRHRRLVLEDSRDFASEVPGQNTSWELHNNPI